MVAFAAERPRKQEIGATLPPARRIRCALRGATACPERDCETRVGTSSCASQAAEGSYELLTAVVQEVAGTTNRAAADQARRRSQLVAIRQLHAKLHPHMAMKELC